MIGKPLTIDELLAHPNPWIEASRELLNRALRFYLYSQKAQTQMELPRAPEPPKRNLQGE